MKSIKIGIFLLLCSISLMAQQGNTFKMAGTVYDEFDDTLPGGNVYLKDRPGVGTVTDIDGRFQIDANRGDIIIFSYMGYENVEYLVTEEKKDLVIKFTTDAQKIDEVVVVGMGSQRKVSVVGAITSINPDVLQVPATSLANIMGGRVPGVISMQASGEPGKNISEFWIRGIGTFGANSSALVLIDGLEGSLNSIDPADIESFSILKDASATAVYGVRGANGVILVTTKRGQAERLQITARANVTLSSLKGKFPDYLGGYDYAKLANEAMAVRGDKPIYKDMDLYLIQNNLDPDLYPNINWQDEILRDQSWQQTYYMSARGGGAIARYFISLGMSKEDAAYKQDKSSIYSSNVGYNTYQYRTNLDLNLTKTTKLYFGADGHLAVNNAPGIANTKYIWNAQASLTPLTVPKQYSSGHLPAYGPTDAYSPYVMLNYTGKTKTEEYKGKVTLAVDQDLSMITKGLKLKIQGAYDNQMFLKEKRSLLPEMYAAEGRTVNGDLILSKRVNKQSVTYDNDEQWQFRKYHFEANLNYERTFGDHQVSGLIYYYMSDQRNTWDTRFVSGTTKSMAAIPWRYQGISSRLTYGFRDTYMLDVNFGYTGSENFQPGRQFGFFPSVAGGWVLTGYDAVKEKLPWLDFFKIRGSYGSVGNDRIIENRRFPYLTIVSENTAAGWGGKQGISESFVGADNLEWEKAIKSDVGIEGRFFGERFSFIVDYFQDKRDGIFRERMQIPDFLGVMSRPWGNVGKMKSYGSDGNFTYTERINTDMSFTIRGNYTFSKNKVLHWEQVNPKYSYQSLDNLPFGAAFGYIAVGLFKDEDDVLNSPRQSFGDYMPGDIKYKDVNGDGVIDTDDRVPLSYSPYPLLMYGFGGEFQYKNFTAGVLFKGTGKTDFFYTTKNLMGHIPFYGGATGNVLSIVNDPDNRWIPASYSGDPSTENPNARFPRLQYGNNNNNSQVSTWWQGDSRYLRLQEVTLNYNLKNDFIRKLGLSSIDIQAVGSNLWVWNKVKLWDPELAPELGNEYPIPTRYTLQIYLNF